MGKVEKSSRIPELPGQLEFDFYENSKSKTYERYIQQNAGMKLLASETNMLNSSKLEWVTDGKIRLGLGIK